MISNKRDGVRLLGGGDLKSKIKMTVAGATKSAIEAVEKAGGTLEINKPAPKVLEKKKNA